MAYGHRKKKTSSSTKRRWRHRTTGPKNAHSGDAMAVSCVKKGVPKISNKFFVIMVKAALRFDAGITKNDKRQNHHCHPSITMVIFLHGSKRRHMVRFDCFQRIERSRNWGVLDGTLRKHTSLFDIRTIQYVQQNTIGKSLIHWKKRIKISG